MSAEELTSEHRTPVGLTVHRTTERLHPSDAIDPVIDDLDTHLGVVLASNFEYPGRYTRWSRGFSRPLAALHGTGRDLVVEALSERGEVVLAALADIIDGVEAADVTHRGPRELRCTVRRPTRRLPEELRSKQDSVFSVLRAIAEGFAVPGDPYLGLYGAFGYDLVFQFEDIEQRIARDPSQRDLVLFIPDHLVVVDHARDVAHRYRYEFSYHGRSTAGLDAETPGEPYRPAASAPRSRDYEPGEFASMVGLAKESFRRGDLFEVVPGQTFFEASTQPPSAVFRRLLGQNPAPFASMLNLGRQEYLVSGSPEMYVRVSGRRVESCPISGTIRRGSDVFGDAQMIRELLNSAKDEAELTMCTDVDRNDKSRICEPGSVKVIGRRQIEIYSKVIHTVDHIEGRLRDGFDAIDAFLTHMWAVTVTGAPKLWAMRFIERHERTPRVWYGGAIGCLGFDGDLNTGLTLRTVRIKDGVAEVRAGGTLLIDSEPDEEERESELKAAAFLEALRAPAEAVPAEPGGAGASVEPLPGPAPRVLLIDCEDSFVHTLANYVRQAGAEVRTVRAPLPPEELEAQIADFRPALVLLSPGPGRPTDFGTAEVLASALRHRTAVFGVCLGLQAITEYFGGALDLLPYPMHGKGSTVRVLADGELRGGVLAGLPAAFEAGRYHSLHADRARVPAELEVTAQSDDGVVQAVEHRTLPIAAVQFHPESIMSAQEGVGLRLVRQAIGALIDRARGDRVGPSGPLASIP